MYSVKIYGAGSIGNHLSYVCRNKGWDVTVCDIDGSALSRMKNDIYPDRYGKWDDEIVLRHIEQVNIKYHSTIASDLDNLKDTDDARPLIMEYHASNPVDGWFRRYWENGNIRYEWEYKDGKRADGESKGWFPNGNLKQTFTFKNKELVSKRTWYENGQKEREETYKDGELISEKRWDEIDDYYRDEYYDVVIVGTPPETHIPIALEELKSENPPKILLIEKPLSIPNLKGCQKLWDMSKEKGVFVLCGYNHILTENTIESEKLINKGILGESKSLHVQWTEHWGGIFKAHPWIDGPQDCYLGFTAQGGGAMSEHSHGISIWQHFSHLLDYGKIIEISATIKEIDDYDETAILSVKTEKGLVGTILMDVVTNPPVKKLRVQGEEDYIEWEVTETADFVRHLEESLIFNKRRSDDFVGEIDYIHALLDGDINLNYLTLESGLDVMMVIAAARLSHNTGMRCIIDYSKGYSLDSIKIKEKNNVFRF